MEASWKTIRYIWNAIKPYSNVTSRDAEKIAEGVFKEEYSHYNLAEEFRIPGDIAAIIISEVKYRINESRESSRDSF